MGPARAPGPPYWVPDSFRVGPAGARGSPDYPLGPQDAAKGPRNRAGGIHDCPPGATASAGVSLLATQPGLMLGLLRPAAEALGALHCCTDIPPRLEPFTAHRGNGL